MPDYRQLWEDKSGEAPKESVIAGLQKLINNKQDEIIEMDAQVQGLKGRIQEYNEILVDMEKEYKQQQQRIKELEAELGGDSSSSYSSTSVQEAEGSGNALKVRQLQAKLNEMQNKLFIYSNLPSRITDLEGKLEEKDEIIDEYADKVEDLRKRMNNLSEDEGAKKVIANMEDKIERQKETIKKIRSGQESGGGRIDSSDLASFRDKASTLKIENEELKKQLHSLQNTIQSLQEGGGSGSINTSMSNAELMAENNRLSNEVENLRKQIKEKDLKLEEIIERVQKGQPEKDLGSTEKINNLKTKIERLKSENKRLKKATKKEEVQPSLGSGPSKPKLRPSAPKIREISSGADSGAGSELKKELKTTKKQLAEKESQIKNINNQLIEAQTQLAELKAQGPGGSGGDNMMELLQDLQTKIRRLKGVVKQKDQKIAELENK